MGVTASASRPELNHGQVMSLEIPVVVRLAQRTMRVGEVLDLAPGSILELQKNAESELEILVNNRAVGLGVAVKVGENFGLRITHMGDASTRKAGKPAPAEPTDPADTIAEALLAGQLG